VASGNISSVAGNGTAGFSGDGGLATVAGLNNPSCVVVDSRGNLLIADSGNNRIRWGGRAGGREGKTCTGQHACTQPRRLPWFDWHCRRVDAVTGIITTVAGNGAAGFSGDGGAATSASLNGPMGIAVDAAGNIYVADTANHRLR
jgi:hypothetical protein